MTARAASIFAVVVAGVALLGWQIDAPALRAWVAGGVAMNPVTALAIILAAGSLWLRTGSSSDRPALRRVARAVASLVVLIGVVTLAGYLIGNNPGLDQLLFAGRLAGNRMAPNTGLNFVLLGAALLALDWQPRGGVWPAGSYRRRSSSRCSWDGCSS